MCVCYSTIPIILVIFRDMKKYNEYDAYQLFNSKTTALTNAVIK